MLRRAHVGRRCIGATSAGAMTILILLGSARSQQSETVEPTREQMQLQLAIMRDYVKQLENGSKYIDTEVLKAYQSARVQEYKYLEEKMNLSLRGYDAQRWTSYVLLGCVVLVVVSGVVFSGLQLWTGMHAGVQTSNELEFSASRVRVTSSVIGVVVLAISMAFLYVYIKDVYPIRVVGSEADQQLDASALQPPMADKELIPIEDRSKKSNTNGAK
jgi:hypothetical protein